MKINMGMTIDVRENEPNRLLAACADAKCTWSVILIDWTTFPELLVEHTIYHELMVIMGDDDGPQ